MNVAIDIYARVSLRIRQVSIVIHWMFCDSEQLYSGIDFTVDYRIMRWGRGGGVKPKGDQTPKVDGSEAHLRLNFVWG